MERLKQLTLSWVYKKLKIQENYNFLGTPLPACSLINTPSATNASAIFQATPSHWVMILVSLKRKFIELFVTLLNKSEKSMLRAENFRNVYP